jgi:hypothetical protein
MTTVPISARRGLVQVELEDLTPTAAAIARIWSANRLHTPCPLQLQSTRTLREMGADPEEAVLWWGAAAMDQPHRFVLDVPATLPGGYGAPMATRLEAMAQRVPVGYMPVGGGDPREPVALDAAALAADAEYITRDEVLELLRKLGRPITSATLYNYTRNPPADWPGIARYVGRTPQWSRDAIEAYARLSS